MSNVFCKKQTSGRDFPKIGLSGMHLQTTPPCHIGRNLTMRPIKNRATASGTEGEK